MTERAPTLETKLKNLTEDPGVYLMKDAAGGILYVGKAKSLRSRVSSYFQESKDHSPKTLLLVSKIADFDVFLTDNEVEALVLECNLIKKHRPRFNIRLRDDKSYPYVRLDVKHPFPRLEYVRRVRKDGARYFGPYVSALQIKEVLRWARRSFRLRDCSDIEFRNRARACILSEMGQCSAPCVGKISEADYQRDIDSVLSILDGNVDPVLKSLRTQMTRASEEERFEDAARIRDQMRTLEEISQSQKITDPESEQNRDVIHYARSRSALGDQDGAGVVVLLAVRDGRASGVQHFRFERVPELVSDGDFLSEFLAQYYLDQNERLPDLLPSEVLLPALEERENARLAEQSALLSRALGKRIAFRVPQRGAAKELLAMVEKTAATTLREALDQAEGLADDLADLARRLDLPRYPRRVECFDISHFQGEGTVASRVVFIDGKPDKSLYRHYHVETVGGVDDFRSLREVLERRLAHDRDLPDLLLVDGGKGQLAQAVAVAAELGISGVPIAAIAKARTERSFSEEEVKATLERVFLPGRKNPVFLKPGTGAYRVVTRARDEAHRFAIAFHRSVRDRARHG